MPQNQGGPNLFDQTSNNNASTRNGGRLTNFKRWLRHFCCYKLKLNCFRRFDF
jgi:hypothetical protein